MENLPVEIIRKIFLELSPPPTTFPLHDDEPRLLVTHVCSRWRSIALSTPTLWASYYIEFVTFCPAPQPEPIRAWISRTAQSLLSFTFYGSAFEVSPIVSDLVLPIIHRCSLLAFSLNIVTLNRLLTLPPELLHMLQSIAITVEDDTQITDPTSFATAFQSCPQLHTFALVTDEDYHPENLRIANFCVPWHQLTTLRLCSPSILVHECLDILHQCTSLQECGIHISPINNFILQRVIEHSHRPAVLPFLHTLYTKFLDLKNNNYHLLWHALCLPSLRKFQPMGPTRPALWSLPKFRSVLCDTIKELDLSGFKFPESLPETLALVPNVETLWLGRGSHKYPGIMRALGEGALSPRLTALHFSSMGSFNFLFDMVEARITAARADPGITALTEVTVLNRGIEPVDKARLMALTESGVRIHLGHPMVGMEYRP